MENELTPDELYPVTIGLYKGENRVLIIPYIYSVAGLKVQKDWFLNLKETENSLEIGNNIFIAIDEVKKSPLDCRTANERKAVWKSSSKYKGWISFSNNHLCTHVYLYENGEYRVMSTERYKSGYCGCVKEIMLSPESTAEDIGRAVIDVFKAAEEFYEVKK